MAARKKLRLCADMSVAETVDYLNDLIRGLQAGAVTVMREDESVTLTPGAEISVRARARARRKKQSFSLRLAWRVEKPADAECADKHDDDATKPVAAASSDK
ncbi:hypothetical protein RAS1_42760 [Phycisphaerae bacterium RAS1]|nr:hypothetical protein RAS1_42760 [Phycisphaerae bacterium RAS1]